MDPPSPPARINSNRSSPTKAVVDVSQPETRTSQSSLWLDRSLHLPCDFPSSRTSGSRLASVAMISQSAAAEELTRASMDLESSRNSTRRMNERPSVRLASMAQTFNLENDNYKRKYQDLLQDKIATEEALSKIKTDMQREVDSLTSTVATERRNTEKWSSQYKDVSKRLADLESSNDARLDELECENNSLKARMDASLRNHTKELMEIREETRNTIDERVAQETSDLRRTVQDRTQQAADLRRALAQAQDTIERLETNADSLKQTMDALERVHAAAIKVCEEDAEERIKEANDKARQWEDDMVEQGMRIRTIQHDLNTANNTAIQFKQEAARIRNDFEDFRDDTARQRADTDRRHASEMAQLRAQVDDATDRLAHSKEDILKKDDMLHQLHTEQKRMRNNLNDATKDVTFLRAECDAAQRATEEARNDLRDLEVKYDNLSEDHEVVCGKLMRLLEEKNNSDDSSATASKLDRITKEYHNATSQWNEQRAALVEAENLAHDKNVNLEHKIATLEASLRSATRSGVSDSSVATVRQLRTELANANANNIDLMRQLDVVKDKCSQQKRDIAKYQSQISDLECTQGGLVTHSLHNTPDVEEPAPQHRVRGEKASRSALEPIVPVTNVSRGGYEGSARDLLSKDSIMASLKPVKKAVFAITGISGTVNLVDAITAIPHAEVCSAPSDAPIPAEVTHIISNGNLTIKVLTALVRGCWVLPPTYVAQCNSNGLASEAQHGGFRHTDLPLAGKVIGITAGFRQGQYGKHLQDIAQEGGATIKFINMTTDDAAEIRHYSFVACLKAELQSFPKNGKTWDSIVQSLFPTTVQNFLKAELTAFAASVMTGGNQMGTTNSSIPFRSAPSSMTPAY